jgi:signal transduction histidine kinase
MRESPLARRIVPLVLLGVGLPALLLAGLGIALTLRVAGAVERDAIRYNAYLAHQVVAAYEQELMIHLRAAARPAENAARVNASIGEIMAALAEGTGEFEEPHFVAISELTDYTLLIVESQPLIYSSGGPTRPGQYFAGVLLRDAEGQVVGAGGWWVDAREFLEGHLEDVVRERLPSNPRMYGGIESTRRLSVELIGPAGERLARVRDPQSPRTARSAELTGPFQGYVVQVAATSDAPVVWTERYAFIQAAFIAIMALAILLATVFGLRYIIRQLELAQLKAGFVSNVTHELKTPIALIRLAVETLELGRVRSPEESQKFIQSIGRETQRLSQLVDNILDFAKLEAGQRALAMQRVDANDVVHDALESMAPRLESLGFKIETRIAPALPPVEADPRALSHCVLNLLDNAIKYSRERREIEVETAARDGHVTISVSDRGIGIAPADQKRIFEKFVRVQAGLVHDVKGAGLGLSLVDQIMQAHGGRVDVRSAEGQGSTFTLMLPAVATETPRQEPALRAGSLRSSPGEST